MNVVWKECLEMLLEFFKVTLTGPVLFAVVLLYFIRKFKDEISNLLNRISTISFGGAAVNAAPQALEKKSTELPSDSIEKSEQLINDLSSKLDPDEREQMNHIIELHKTNAAIWEYRYLNLFLAPRSQVVLNWLIGLNHTTTWELFDSYWQPQIPDANERQRIYQALQSHNLIQSDEIKHTITVTEKAKAYQEWRGPLPPPPSAHVAPPEENPPPETYNFLRSFGKPNPESTQAPKSKSSEDTV